MKRIRRGDISKVAENMKDRSGGGPACMGRICRSTQDEKPENERRKE